MEGLKVSLVGMRPEWRISADLEVLSFFTLLRPRAAEVVAIFLIKPLESERELLLSSSFDIVGDVGVGLRRFLPLPADGDWGDEGLTK